MEVHQAVEDALLIQRWEKWGPPVSLTGVGKPLVGLLLNCFWRQEEKTVPETVLPAQTAQQEEARFYSTLVPWTMDHGRGEGIRGHRHRGRRDEDDQV